MKLSKLVLQKIAIPFRESFKHSSAERSETESVWVTAQSESGYVGYGESCPRSYVTGEDLNSVKRFFTQYVQDLIQAISTTTDLKRWMSAHQADINKNHAAWCAIELAILDLLGKEENQSIEKLLGLPELSGTFHYSAIIGDANIETFQKHFIQYRSLGFTDFKIKLSGDLQRDKEWSKWIKAQMSENLRFRCDANNLWTSSPQASDYLRQLNFPFWAIEEPLIGEQFDQLLHLSQSLDVKIILDESITRVNQISQLEGDAANWIINLRVSKMGGIIRSLNLANSARKNGLSLIIGAQVGETSLLTRAALPIAQSVRDRLIAQEGAFGSLLLQHDVCDSPLMFGKNGMLDLGSISLDSSGGLGLPILPDLPFLKSLD